MGPKGLHSWPSPLPTLPSSPFPPLPLSTPLRALRCLTLPALRSGGRTYCQHHDDGDHDSRCFWRPLSFPCRPPSCSSSENVVVEPQDSDSPPSLPRIAVLMEVEGFFHRKPKALAIFRTYSKLEILRPTKTRFAYMIIAMKRLIKVQDSLRQTVLSNAWKAWPGSKEPDALKVQQNAFHPEMWTLAESLMKTLQPIYNVLRLSDSEGCTLGLIYEFMDKVGESLNKNSSPGIRPERVVADIHRFGHRHAFNVAFQKLGLDCAHWTEPVYRDLLRLAGGDEEKMLLEFFERIGWPMALPTGEEGAFIQHLLQEKKIALENRIINGSVSLRPGVENFVDEVIEARVPLVVLGAYNKIGETVTRSLIGKLGVERSQNIIFVGEKEVQNSVYGQVVFGAGSSSGPDEALAIEAAKAVLAEKQRMAEEVAAMLGVTVEIDTGSSKLSGQAIALLRAGAEMAGLPVQQCILLAGGYLGVQTAERIGMPCVAVRSSLTARAEFPSAIAVLDDFGSGSLSLTRLRKLRYP